MYCHIWKKVSHIGVMIEACLTYVTKHPALIRAAFAVPIWKVFTFGLRCALYIAKKDQ